MPKQKLPPPCSGYEFSIRRHAAGLENQIFVDLMGCSISSVTKWSAGFLPVSRKALALVEEVEIAIANEVDRLVDEFCGMNEPILVTEKEDWPYGQSSYEIAVSRARVLLADQNPRIIPASGRVVPLKTQPYALVDALCLGRR